MKIRRLTIIYLLLIFTFSFQSVTFAKESIVIQTAQSPQIFWRTELYFGRDKNDGTKVSDEDWEKFLDEVVTPKFPQGLTVIDSKGQWRNDAGEVIKESSKVLILLYPTKFRKSSSRKIEEIRQAYKKMFNQQSVMRVDTRQNHIYF